MSGACHSISILNPCRWFTALYLCIFCCYSSLQQVRYGGASNYGHPFYMKPALTNTAHKRATLERLRKRYKSVGGMGEGKDPEFQMLTVYHGLGSGDLGLAEHICNAGMAVLPSRNRRNLRQRDGLGMGCTLQQMWTMRGRMHRTQGLCWCATFCCFNRIE